MKTNYFIGVHGLPLPMALQQGTKGQHWVRERQTFNSSGVGVPKWGIWQPK